MKKLRQQAGNVPMGLGASLRARRKALSLSMQSVADAAGLSVGFVSQVERNLTTPSLSSLANLAEALDRPITAFLDPPAAQTALTRQRDRVPYSVEAAAVTYERISTQFAGSQLSSVIVHEPPGYRSEPISHRGEEIFFVLNGQVTVEIEGRATILRAGDSIHFDSTRVHSTWNHSTETVSFLHCCTLDVFGDAPAPIHKNGPRADVADPTPTGENT